MNMLRRKQHRTRVGLPHTPRMLTPDELIVMEPEEQFQHLLREMNRSIPENPVINSNMVATNH